MAADAAAAGVQLPDSRGVGKVPAFTGKRGDFEYWIFPFWSYCGLLGWTARLELARDAEKPFSVEHIGEQGVQVGWGLYHLLASTTEVAAQSIVKLCQRGDGFEDRQGKERFTEVPGAWGELISLYERATGEEVTQNMETGAIMARAPDDVTMPRSAQRDARIDIAQIRTCIFEAAIGQSGVIAKPLAAGRSSSGTGVDAISKGKSKQGSTDKCQLCNEANHAARDCYWRDRRKQKSGGKGGGKGFGKDGKGKDKVSAAFTGKCDYCRKAGHRKAYCRRFLADEKAKGNAAIEQEEADPKTVAHIEHADFEYEVCDDDQLDCVTMKAEDGDAKCCGVDLDGATFIALDTASVCHVGPTAFGDGCKQGADSGPRLLGAQRQDVKMDTIASLPMAVDDDSDQTKLLKADFRLGDAVSKPIFPLLEVMDKGAEFWLGAMSGMCVGPGGDLAKGVPLSRQNNALGFNAKTFNADGGGGVRSQRERGQEIVLHPDSRVEDLRTRLKELGQPICGRKTLTFDQKDTGRAQITLDFCYLKTNGDWADIGGEEPPAADISATTLVMADRDTLMFNAVSMPTKAVTDYAVASVSSFIERMHLAAADIKTNGEPTIPNLVEEVRKKLSKSIKLEEKRGGLKDSQSTGAIEAPITFFQAKVRTCKFDLGKRYGMKITATRRADLPCRQITATSFKHNGESSFVEGIWIGKHMGRDDHLFPTLAGLHRARTCGWPRPAPRADAKLMKAAKALPWGARSANPRELLPKIQRPLPTIGPTAAAQKAKTEAEAAAAPAAPQRGARLGGASGSTTGGASRTWGAQRRLPDLGRHVDAIWLGDPIDYSVLDSMGTASCVATSGLEPAVELKGKRDALEVLAHYGVHGSIPRSEGGEFKMIEARWEPQMRGGVCKWRYVAQEFKLMEQRGDVRGELISADKQAYCQADQAEKVCVEPPPECMALLAEMGRSTDIVWALDKMLPGLRVAGAGWVDKAAKTLEGEGFERCECQPQFYHHKEKEVLIEATDVIRQGRHSHLKRDKLRLMSGGVMLRQNVKHIEDLIFVMGMEKAKPATVPSLTEKGPTWSPDLDDAEKAKFRTGVGIPLYIFPDRADIQKGRAVAGGRRRASLQMFTDADFATCMETRRAMTCGITKLDGAHFAAFARRQGARATSSGEAEFYGATSVVMGGKLAKNVLEWLGYRVTWELGVDSSAATAIINREGVGKVKHLDVMALWIQQERKVRGLIVKKESSEKNVADLGTKAHAGARFECLRGLAGIVDSSEMDKHKALEACSVAASGSWARRGLLATLLAQGAAESATASTCAVESYKPMATDLVAAVKYADKPMKICEKGSSGPIARGTDKVHNANHPIMLDKMSQAPCAY
ncbi:unnamed protein product, partial [Prorocentrum cordatum]